MGPPPDAPRDVVDRMVRQSLRQPANLRDFLHLAVPDLAGGFDFDRARLLDREFFVEDWRRREADLPFEIPYRAKEGERLALVYVLIEHQSDTDPMMPFRMLSGTVGYWDRQWQAWAQSPRPRTRLQLAPVLPIVLYTGATPWGSNRTLAELLGPPAVFHGFAPRWEPIFWNLADQTPESLLNRDAGWLQLLAVMRAERFETDDFLTVFAPAIRRLAELHDRETVRWHDLLDMILRYALRRRPEAERTALREAASQVNPTHQNEVRTMTRTIAEALIEEGRAEERKNAEAWIEEGRAQGRAEAQKIAEALIEEEIDKGRAEGELRAYRNTLQRLLARNFGSLPEAVSHRIEACTDIARLTANIDAVAQMKSLDELSL